MLVPIILNFSLLFKEIWLFLPFNLGISRIRPDTSVVSGHNGISRNPLGLMPRLTLGSLSAFMSLTVVAASTNPQIA